MVAEMWAQGSVAPLLWGSLALQLCFGSLDASYHGATRGSLLVRLHSTSGTSNVEQNPYDWPQDFCALGHTAQRSRDSRSMEERARL